MRVVAQLAVAMENGDSMTATDAWLREFYDLYPRVEKEFQAALDESLNPRDPKK